MFSIDNMSRIPVYEQFIAQVELFLLKGILKGGDRLPSVRNLAVEMSVNPNTVQKALSELDRRGVIYSVPGKGSYIAQDALDQVRKTRRKGISEVKETLKGLILAGVTKEELLACVEEVYAEEDASAKKKG